MDLPEGNEGGLGPLKGLFHRSNIYLFFAFSIWTEASDGPGFEKPGKNPTPNYFSETRTRTQILKSDPNPTVKTRRYPEGFVMLEISKKRLFINEF